MKHELIKIDSVVKEFGDNRVLDGLSLSVREGEVVVIVGPSGCGKSTLLRCINGLEPIQGGEITFRGQKVDGNSRSIVGIRQKVGMVFQNYELFPHMTILENIVLSPVLVQKRGRKEVEEEAMQLLSRVGLEEKRDSFPRELSGGQKQRVAIVRALCMHPEVLLFDEVTAALDPEMVREVLDVMLTLATRCPSPKRSRTEWSSLMGAASWKRGARRSSSNIPERIGQSGSSTHLRMRRWRRGRKIL